MNVYIICCGEKLGEHHWALLKHDYSISTEFSYQIPPNQGFPDHYFELRELQGIMQNFSYKLISFLSLSIELDIKYISFISNPHIRFLQIKASRVKLQTQGTSG